VDFSFSEDQSSLRELARKILDERSGHERLKQVEAGEERVDRELWAELARASLLGVALAEEWGGTGFGLPELLILVEEVGRAVAHAPVHPTLVLGALPIQQFGSAEQKRRYLPRVASGAALLSAALVESPAGGGDPAAPSTRARRDGEGWRLDGRKLFVPVAHVAERVLVPARTGPGGVGIFLVDPRGPGVSLERQETTSLEIECVLDLDGARVAAADVLGPPEGGARIATWIAERALASLCALQLGNCEKALRDTATYTSERRQFDRPIGSFQAVHQRAADAYIDVEAMRLSYWQAVHRLAVGEPAAEALALAKFWAAEGGARVSYAAQHLHGGIGVDTDYPLHRHYLWARQIGLTLGPAQAQLARLGAALASAPA
jgi:hypothetical protein